MHERVNAAGAGVNGLITSPFLRGTPRKPGETWGHKPTAGSRAIGHTCSFADVSARNHDAAFLTPPCRPALLLLHRRRAACRRFGGDICFVVSWRFSAFARS